MQARARAQGGSQWLCGRGTRNVSGTFGLALVLQVPSWLTHDRPRRLRGPQSKATVNVSFCRGEVEDDQMSARRA